MVLVVVQLVLEFLLLESLLLESLLLELLQRYVFAILEDLSSYLLAC